MLEKYIDNTKQNIIFIMEKVRFHLKLGHLPSLPIV